MYFKLLHIVIFWTTLTTQLKAENECTETQPIKVLAKQGILKGLSMKTMKQKSFCAFLGIPFAEPPIDELRFKPPRPSNPWKGERLATNDSKSCIQSDYPNMKTIGDEDCLYLNVYTPKLKVPNGSLLDVLVWIHPGAFYAGSDSSVTYKPHSWMDMNIVLVSINYRLGAFGFLSTGDDEAPGNYGLKDQVMALKWVQDNIAVFGGDPNKVTLCGHSSGGASVHYHMFSQLSKGLFHRAISMEGTALNPWAWESDPKSLAVRQARYLGCPENPSSALVSCLKKLPAKKINDSIAKLFLFWLIPTPGFTPVVEKKTERNPEPFLTEEPYAIMLNGSFNKVPWLMGGNSNSMSFYFAPLMSLKILHDQINEQLRHLISGFLLLEKSAHRNQVQSLISKITNFYDVDLNMIPPEKEMSWITLLSDRHFVHGIHRTALLHSIAGHQPIYKYYFAYRGLLSITTLHTLKNYGVSHGDELIYLFQEASMLMPSNDVEVKELLVNLWTNFIKYGNPTPHNTTDSSSLMKDLTWEPIGVLSNNNMHVHYLNIGQAVNSSEPALYLNQHLGPVKLNMAVDLHRKRMEFWDSLPLYENSKCAECWKESGSSYVQVSIITFTICLCLNYVFLQ